ncbi:uncharacterized protein MELLADRAFT_104835 [Melampsora larici-populina 98AG31]|uniref:Uncharacterized protein n=1 Tax=Melampsora larici-populina (strain 98AG31 / pathotype 3-4-7) TaxID=747676 RepID=F4RGC3_MELLP|nr:uncharacterized protein MELLADRAFT_104835 [Melampsora larici-populina 98AG31]EGG08687.1 hypothetical protein MELLADRAFT_104835 [Melampsora larici-populina 98AG31]
MSKAESLHYPNQFESQVKLALEDSICNEMILEESGVKPKGLERERKKSDIDRVNQSGIQVDCNSNEAIKISEAIFELYCPCSTKDNIIIRSILVVFPRSSTLFDQYLIELFIGFGWQCVDSFCTVLCVLFGQSIVDNSVQNDWSDTSLELSAT